MEVLIQVPTSEVDTMTAILSEKSVVFDHSIKKNLDGGQIANFVITYGPGALAVLNGLLEAYMKLRKIRALSIKLEVDKNDD